MVLGKLQHQQFRIKTNTLRQEDLVLHLKNGTAYMYLHVPLFVYKSRVTIVTISP